MAHLHCRRPTVDHWRGEEGIALVLALLVLVTLSLGLVTVLNMASSAQHSSSYATARQSAGALAESGLAMAESTLNALGANASSPTLLGCSTSAENVNNSAPPCVDLNWAAVGGTIAVHGLFTQGTGNSGTWTVTATGNVANPQGGAPINRRTTATITVTGGGQSNNISVWNYIYSTAPQGSGCEVDLSGDHTMIQVPMYVTGDLCLSGNHAQIIENKDNGGQAVDLRVGGTMTLSGDESKVGQDARHPILSGYVAGGCRTSTNGSFHPCTSADNYYVSQNDLPLTATPPTTDFPGWYENASPGPKHPCDPALTPAPALSTTKPNAFDNDTTMNGTNNLFILTPTGPSSDYNCVTSTGTLNWSHATHVLTIRGTMFFDGNVQLNDDNAMYDGKGTIYVNGSLSFNDGHGAHAGISAACFDAHRSNIHHCDINGGPGRNHWDPNEDMLVFAVNKSTGVAVDLSADQSKFQGDLLCPPTATVNLAGDHTVVEGGIICGKFTWANHTQIFPMPTITNLPPGAPLPPNAPATISPPVISD